MGRVAKKVFLEFKEPFSSEKGSLPPEALERSAALERSDKYGKKALKGVWGKNKSFAPRGKGFGENPEGCSPSVFGKRSFTKTRDFGGSMPTKSPESAQTAKCVPREKQAANCVCSHDRPALTVVTAHARFFGFDARKIASPRAAQTNLDGKTRHTSKSLPQSSFEQEKTRGINSEFLC